jgi:ABC-type uncharacterized transport system substrate-binding protein
VTASQRCGSRIRRLVTRAAFAALAGLGPAWAPAAGAHPHVFVEHVVTVSVGPEGPDALRLAWTFDDMFSSMLVQTFDADKDRALSPAEVKAMEQRHFGHLKEFGFFVHLRVNDRPVVGTGYRDFQARVVNGQVVYTFTVPVKAAEGMLEVAVEDPTYYAAFALNARAGIQVEGGKNFRVDCRREGGGFSEVVKCAVRRQGR